MNSKIKILGVQFTVQNFVLFLFSFLLMEGIFSWIFIPNSNLTEVYIKLSGIVIYGFMLFKFYSLKPVEKIFLIVFTLILVRLVLESLYRFDSFFKQLTMFSVLVPVIYALFIKYIFRSLQLDVLGFISKFYLISYIAFMVLFGRGFSFSLEGVEMDDYGPFSGDSRIIHASHIFQLIIPLLWFLNQYLKKKKIQDILIVCFVIFVLIIHQHRSVWSSALFALGLYVMASIRNRHQQPGKYMSLFIYSIFFAILAYIFVSNLVPGFTSFLGERFAEIFDPAKEGSTGNFRIEQREVYFKLFLQRPVFGWTFEGFEMSNPLVDWWPEMTGQHFHEGYMEMLFYHGVVGLIFKYSIPFYLIGKIFSKNLSSETIILISFSLAGLVFSFNYVPPLMFWGHVGLCLYYLEKDEVIAAITKRQFAAQRINPNLKLQQL